MVQDFLLEGFQIAYCSMVLHLFMELMLDIDRFGLEVYLIKNLLMEILYIKQIRAY